MSALIGALVVLIIGYGVYRVARKLWKEADLYEKVKEREENSKIYEKYKPEMTSTARDDAQFCRDKIDNLSNSKY